jgi:Phosphotransferase enzyme family
MHPDEVETDETLVRRLVASQFADWADLPVEAVEPRGTGGCTVTSTGRNLLVTDGRLSVVVDFGCLGVGDAACDVAVAWKVLSAETRDIFRCALSVDDATWARARGRVLYEALGALAYYTTGTNPYSSSRRAGGWSMSSIETVQSARCSARATSRRACSPRTVSIVA